MTAVANQLAAAIELLLERIYHPPAANCSCHLSPPCGDCVDYGGLREAIQEAEAALAAHGQAALCGTCNDEIKPDALTGTTCKCAKAPADPMAAAMYGHDLHPEGYAPPTVQPSQAVHGAGVSISDDDRAVLQRLQYALPTVGINGWAKGVEVLERLLRDSLAALTPPSCWYCNGQAMPVSGDGWETMRREWCIEGMPADKQRLARAAFVAGAAGAASGQVLVNMGNSETEYMRTELTEWEERARAVDLDELRRAVCVVGVVGQIDGHDVVRRNSVLDVIDTRRQRLTDSQAVGNG